MLILKADRLGTTARVPVSYPALFQTDWYMDEGEVIDLSIPVARSSHRGASSPMNPSAYKCSYLITRFAWKSPRCDGWRAIGLVWNFSKMQDADKDRLLGLVKDFYA
jgi:hypothetical protein